MTMEFELFFLVIPSVVIVDVISLVCDFEHAVKGKHNNADISNTPIDFARSIFDFITLAPFNIIYSIK